jgi:glutathione S-transferase
MPEKLKLYNLHPSPNSMKARVALAYKELPYERIDVSPTEREEIVRVSGQPLTPVLVDGKTVIFDSGAILRYLEANYRKTRPIYSSDYDTMKAIEKWELFGQTDLGPGVGPIFGQIFAGTAQADVIKQANEKFNAACKKLESELATRRYLVGDTLTAADIVLGSIASCGRIKGASEPITQFFEKHLHLDPSLKKVAEWIDRVRAYDRSPVTH